MPTPTMDEYHILCSTLFDTVRTCTPSPAIGCVIAADLAAQVLSLHDMILTSSGETAPDEALTAWLATFVERYRELQQERAAAAAAPDADDLPPVLVIGEDK